MAEISKKIRDMRKAGHSIPKIALACECSIYLVRKELSKYKKKKVVKKPGANGRSSAGAGAGTRARNSRGKAGKVAKKGVGTGKKTKKTPRKPRKKVVDEATLVAKRLAGKKEAFLAAYGRLANVKKACDAAGIPRSSYYEWVKKDKEFARAADDAKDDAIDTMEAEAHRRAVHGLERRKLHKGKQVMVPELDARGRVVLGDDDKPVMIAYIEREYSDSLLNTMLRAERPDKYADRSKAQVDNTHSLDGEARKAIAAMTPSERECRLNELLDNIRKVGG